MFTECDGKCGRKMIPKKAIQKSDEQTFCSAQRHVRRNQFCKGLETANSTPLMSNFRKKDYDLGY